MPDPIIKPKTGVKKATTNYYKPQKNLMIFEYGNKCHKKLSIEQYLEKIKRYFRNMMDELKVKVNGKFI